jgi:hypothetical protein
MNHNLPVKNNSVWGFFEIVQNTFFKPVNLIILVKLSFFWHQFSYLIV